jgi:hypothetical protein
VEELRGWAEVERRDCADYQNPDHIALLDQAAAHIARTEALLEEARAELERAAHNLEAGRDLHQCPGLDAAAKFTRRFLAKLEAGNAG